MPIDIPRVHSTETCPLEGYEQLQVRVLANTSDAAWKRWMHGHLGIPDCEAVRQAGQAARQARQEGRSDAQPTERGPRLYCPACQAARVAYGESIVLLYGPELLGEDVSTPAAALRCSTATTPCPARWCSGSICYPASCAVPGRTRSWET